MRVVLLSQWYQNTGSGIVGGVAQALVELGCQVVVVTGSHSYADQMTPTVGQRFGLLGRRSPSEGIAVLRYPFFQSHDQSTLRRFTTYGSFTASALGAVPVLRSADVVLAYSSPATAVLPAAAATVADGPPFVMMIQDVWPDSVFATGFVQGGLAHGLAQRSLTRYMDFLYRKASGVTVLSPGMRDLLIDRGVDPEITRVVYNWTDEDLASKVVYTPRTPGQPLHVMYAGNIGPAQNLSNVLRALAMVPNDQVRFTLVGDGAAIHRLKGEVQRLGLTNVHFIGRVPRDQMPGLLSTAHLHLVSLDDSAVFNITLPSKFQALIAAGLPVLTVAPGEIAEIVRSQRLGLAAPPDDPTALAQVLGEAIGMSPAALAEFGRNGGRYYREKMSRRVNAARLCDLLQQAARRRQ